MLVVDAHGRGLNVVATPTEVVDASRQTEAPTYIECFEGRDGFAR